MNCFIRCYLNNFKTIVNYFFIKSLLFFHSTFQEPTNLCSILASIQMKAKATLPLVQVYEYK